MKLNDEQKKFLEQLYDAGIGYQIMDIYGSGYRELNVDQVVEYLRDTDAWFAEVYGVSIETLRKVEEFNDDSRCISMTRQGHRCKNNCNGAFRSPKEFVDGVTNVCPTHREVGLTYEKRQALKSNRK
jgi:hypothetical protein